MASTQIVDILVLAFVASFLTTAGGMIIGDALQPRASTTERWSSPPIECGVTVDAPTLTLATPTAPRSSKLKPPTHAALRRVLFFNFERAMCDHAEAVRGDVLRCSYARADRR